MKIVIVGGGTAGWLSALFINKVRPEHEITIIESSNIGIIGAGEGSTGLLTDVIRGSYWDFGCDHDEFLKETGATLKYGIKHVNWTGDNSFYYGPIDSSISYNSIPDGAFASQYYNFPKDKLHTCSLMGLYLETQKANVDLHSKRFHNHYHALHFDAHLLAKYLKKVVLRSPQVKLIDSEVVDISVGETGIESILLSNDQKILADFFVDATGFKKILISKLGAKWISYKKHLPVNSAIPFILNYDENEYPEPYTLAQAQSSGWMWQIPNLNRKGCGYVFSDDFITPDRAQEEIEKKLNQKIEPIKLIKFDSGRLDNPWIKNCLSVGLSAAFSEPLEATSIHTTLVQLNKFVFEYLKPTKILTCNEFSIKNYNNHINKMYDDMKDFLVLHYMGGRTDSKFWKYISNGDTKTEFVNTIIEMSKSRMPTYNDFEFYKGAAGWSIWAWVLAGTNNLSPDVAKRELDFFVLGYGNYGSAAFRELMNWKENTIKSFENNMFYKDFIKFQRNQMK